MFDKLSRRALQVIFLTRIKAGQRGADALDVGDLIVAIVVEDQDRIEEFLRMSEGTMGRVAALQPRTPFFSTEAASYVLTNLEALLAHSTPIPGVIDMPMTADLQRLLEPAEKLRNDLQHSQVEPLHLLAAAFQEQSRPEIDLLIKAGITEESVLARLRQS